MRKGCTSHPRDTVTVSAFKTTHKHLKLCSLDYILSDRLLVSHKEISGWTAIKSQVNGFETKIPPVPDELRLV